MKKANKVVAVIGLILSAAVVLVGQAPRFTCAFQSALPTWENWKAYSPYPMNYVARLKMLEGWNAEVGDGLNCSGFVSNAHGVSFRKSYDFYSNAYGDMTLLAEVASVRAINETQLQPGDVAAFEGQLVGKKGAHVAAYLGNGIWIDADGRRGNVAKYHMAEKSAADAFFSGTVRLYRWNGPASFAPRAIISTLGKGN